MAYNQKSIQIQDSRRDITWQLLWYMPHVVRLGVRQYAVESREMGASTRTKYWLRLWYQYTTVSYNSDTIGSSNLWESAERDLPWRAEDQWSSCYDILLLLWHVCFESDCLLWLPTSHSSYLWAGQCQKLPVTPDSTLCMLIGYPYPHWQCGPLGQHQGLEVRYLDAYVWIWRSKLHMAWLYNVTSKNVL